YKQLHAMAHQVANGLRARGFGPGDRIGLSCPNTPHFPIAYYGILALGGVVVPINVLFKPREIAWQLSDGDAKAVIVFEGTPELPMAHWAREACASIAPSPAIIVITIDPAAASPIDGAIT